MDDKADKSKKLLITNKLTNPTTLMLLRHTEIGRVENLKKEFNITKKDLNHTY